MSNDHSLHDLMLDEIRDLYDAEQQLVKALPKIAEAANDKLTTIGESGLNREAAATMDAGQSR